MRIAGRYALVAALAAWLVEPAAAQVPPYVYALTVGTAQIQVIGANTARKRLIFHNPNDQAKVAVCPAGPTRTGATVTAAINGAGCITILPYDRVEISGSTASGPQQSMPSAWVAIASSPASSLTIIELE